MNLITDVIFTGESRKHLSRTVWYWGLMQRYSKP